MNCFYCKGDMSESVTTHFTDLSTCMIIIKNVPCNVCMGCGATAYSLVVAERLEQIITTSMSALTEVAILHYSELAA